MCISVSNAAVSVVIAQANPDDQYNTQIMNNYGSFIDRFNLANLISPVLDLEEMSDTCV